jgi:hypothetical protein
MLRRGTWPFVKKLTDKPGIGFAIVGWEKA